MALAIDTPFQTARAQAAARPDPDVAPLVLNPAELRQLWHCYHDLLDLHHAEVADEDFEDAHRLLIDQVLPLQEILKGRQRIVIDPRAHITF